MSTAAAVPLPVAAPRATGTRRGRLTRLRAAAAAGGLAVLLTGSVVGHLEPASAAGSSATSVASFAGGFGVTSVASVTRELSAVARTGGQR